MARRSSAGSQADMAQIPDWAPYDSIAFNKQFNMKEYEAYAASQRSSGAPFTLGGRRWWAASGHILSGIVIMVAIAAEALFILRDASAVITTLPVAPSNDSADNDDELTSNEDDISVNSTATDAKRLARRLLIRAAKNATKAAKAKAGAKANATKDDITSPFSSSNYTCQWANNTDVLNT